MKALCNTLDCSLFGTKGHKDGADSTYCAGEECNENDEEICCEERATCDDMLPGDGSLYCDSYETCGDAGWAPNPGSRLCADTGCTKEICCNTVGGLPPPPTSRPATVHASREVAQFTMRITGLSLAKTTSEQQVALKDGFCEVVSENTGTAISQCECVLSAGSIVGTTTITTNEGEILGDVRTPSPDAVLAKVTSIPDIERAQQGTMPISVAAVQGVVFRKDQTAAEVMKAPTPPAPPPTTPPADDSEDDEESGACGNIAPAFLLPMVLVQFA
jgi:hypothetical protein